MSHPMTTLFIRTGRLAPIAAACSLTLLLSACASLTASPEPAAAAQAALPASWTVATTNGTAAELRWQDFISDERLRGVIALALDNSRDLRSALLAVEQARATYRIQGAAQLPTINASTGLSATRTPGEASSSGNDTLSRQYSATLGTSAYEIDLFGRVAALKDSALQSYLASAQSRRSVQLTLIGDVSSAWLTLDADLEQLALARLTLDSQQRTQALNQKRLEAGAITALALAQAQVALDTARGSVAQYESQVQRDRLALELLVGASVPPALLPSGDSAQQRAALVAVPAGLPSSVLQRRPDVQSAELSLLAARADLEAARAALYPRISLTASAGTASRSLSDLFQGGLWTFVPSISLPLFDGGASAATVDKAQVARDIRLVAYEKTVQTAFKEVADALAVRSTLDERLAAQRSLVQANQTALTLSQQRFEAGADTYLAVLDAQRSLWSAQQGLITLRQSEQANRVTLYKALGGTWSDEKDATRP